MNQFRIELQRPVSNEVIALLRTHHQEMFEHSPPENVHALDESKFQSDKITFWGVYQKSKLAGCGALMVLDDCHGEIKAMRTNPDFTRKGVATAVLSHILDEAKNRGYQQVSLETGTMDFFAAARNLYHQFGFMECPPFADYFDDPHSVCMTLTL